MPFVHDLSISGSQRSFLGFEDEPNPDSYVALSIHLEPFFWWGGRGGGKEIYFAGGSQNFLGVLTSDK